LVHSEDLCNVIDAAILVFERGHLAQSGLSISDRDEREEKGEGTGRSRIEAETFREPET